MRGTDVSKHGLLAYEALGLIGEHPLDIGVIEHMSDLLTSERWRQRDIDGLACKSARSLRIQRALFSANKAQRRTRIDWSQCRSAETERRTSA